MVSGNPKLLAVDLDDIFAGIGLGTKFGNDMTIYRHPPLLDHLFCLATRRDAGVSKYLLQSFSHRKFIVANSADI